MTERYTQKESKQQQFAAAATAAAAAEGVVEVQCANQKKREYPNPDETTKILFFCTGQGAPRQW